jgi:hypothetical protein
MQQNTISLLPNSRAVARYNQATNSNTDLHINHIWSIIRMFPNIELAYIAVKHKHTTLDLIRKYYHGNSKINLVNVYCQSNSYVLWQDIQQNHKLPWNWRKLSNCTTISISNIISHTHLNWNWRLVSARPDITWSIVVSHKMDWSTNALSKNLAIPIKTILANLNFNWSWKRIILRSDVTLDIILDNIDLPWNWQMISANPNITWKLVISHMEIDWDISLLLENPNVIIPDLENSISFTNSTVIILYKDITYKFKLHSDRYISMIPWNIVESNINIRYDWNKIARYANIPIHVLRADTNWNWICLSCNPNYTLEVIRVNQDLPWNWDHISNRMPINTIINNMDLPWSWYIVFDKPDATMDHIIKSNKHQYWRYIRNIRWQDINIYMTLIKS